MFPFVAVNEQRVVSGIQKDEEHFDHIFAWDGIIGILVRRERNLVMLDPLLFHEFNVFGWTCLVHESAAESKSRGT